MKRKKIYTYCLYSSMLVFMCIYYFGISNRILLKSYDTDFDYPLAIDIRPVVNEVLAGKVPTVAPINFYPYKFLTISDKCSTIEKLDLFIVVKSAMHNFNKRDAIRKTYGQENSIPDKIIKTLFFLGIDEPESATQKKIDEEMFKYNDIIQMDFKDQYVNNIIKTTMSFRWLYEHCSNADNYLFVDDDMYISVKNLYKYVLNTDRLNEVENERDRIVFVGSIFSNPVPHRSYLSKWRVSLEEYPWDKYPLYVSGGAFVLSNQCMKMLYVGSLFVKPFRFDDTYLGIVAKKVGITITDSSQFYFYDKKPYSKSEYRDVIAAHGYDDPDELISVWNEQNMV